MYKKYEEDDGDHQSAIPYIDDYNPDTNNRYVVSEVESQTGYQEQSIKVKRPKRERDGTLKGKRTLTPFCTFLCTRLNFQMDKSPSIQLT